MQIRLGLIALFTVFLFCSGEIFSSWEIDWTISSNSTSNYSMLQHTFSIVSEARANFYNGHIDADGRLTETFNVYGYNTSGVEELKPSFVFTLQNDSTILLDTVFSWDAMEFSEHISQKNVTIP